MKKALIYSLVFGLLATAASCRKSDNDFLNTTVHSFKVNNSTYNGGTYDALYKDAEHALTTNFYITEDVSNYMRITLCAHNGITTGNYAVGYDSVNNTSVAVKYVSHGKTYQGVYGTVHITEFNANKSVAAGTFNFKAAAGGDSLTITQGTFNGVYFLKD